jgi:hypothetical protein
VTTPIEEAINIGPRLGAELSRAGIATLEKLKELGYREAWRRLHEVAPERDCTNSCLALVGAIEGVRWMKLPKPLRERIAREAKEGSR